MKMLIGKLNFYLAFAFKPFYRQNFFLNFTEPVLVYIHKLIEWSFIDEA